MRNYAEIDKMHRFYPFLTSVNVTATILARVSTFIQSMSEIL